jgi:hypothetical protein
MSILLYRTNTEIGERPVATHTMQYVQLLLVVADLRSINSADYVFVNDTASTRLP